ncbi:ABC transporter ATP-binding protein [Paenibacillus ginsengarvi]|uniref:ABC transporter ATP-binding protein n=1 Tax=Paenibacillus ginsengarvi TaxID=400777 RepID=A0A3B0BUW1_9BACL|nr:ABC transporter ATP-binding protein [Paenibacillus ginsengarvi]RKN76029.1 ABC transporter ATP-binding protein [Paenibacillus ginsengarvi]
MKSNSLAAVVRGVVPLLVTIGRSMPVLTAVWLLLPLLLGALLVPLFASQKQLIDLFVSGAGAGVGSWSERAREALTPLALMLGAALLRVIVTSAQNVTDSHFRGKASMLVQSLVQQSAVRAPLEKMDDPVYYDRLQRARAVAGEDLFGVLQNAFSALRLATELLGLLAVASAAGPGIALLLAAVFAFSFTIRLEADMVKRRLNRDLTRSGRESDYLRETIVRPETIRDMRIAGSIPYLTDKFAGGMLRSLVLRGNANRREIRRGIASSAAQIAGLFGALVWMASRMADGFMTAGTIIVVFQAMRGAYGISSRAAFPVGKMYIQSAKIVDLIEFLREAKQETGDPSRPALATAGKDDGEGGAETPVIRAATAAIGRTGRIDLERVSYKYAGAASETLRDIRLTLHPGETVALVGDNGAGKSTLVKLLLGLYRPTGGRILWDGVDYRELEPEELRGRVSALFQDFVRYETTLRDNVTFGRLEAGANDESLRRALSAASIDSPERLAGGLDGRVGQLTEGGRSMSGGEWQRLAIARAAFRESQLLVLDEPTAALDPQRESELYRSFRELAKGRTVLFVSHRLGWARFADRIVVLQAGAIAEEGTHDALMAAGGEYASMFRAQAEWYRG